MRRIKFAVLVASFLSLCFVMGGCPKPIKVAYETAVASKAFLDSVKSNHPECNNVASKPAEICFELTRATAAKDVLIDAGEAYCGGAGFEGGKVPCNPPAKGTPALQIAIDKLSAAVANYNQTEKDLKAALARSSQP